MTAKARQDRLDDARLLTDLDDPMDRAAFAHRHLLANAITGAGLQDVRHYLVDLMPGDRLVLDSDGIHDNLASAELEAALLEPASTSPKPPSRSSPKRGTEARTRPKSSGGPSRTT